MLAENCKNGPQTVAPDPFTALAALLGQLADVVRGTSQRQYVQNPVGVVNSSVGSHVRHCLDHFAALCRGAEAGRIDYDDRERGTQVETSPDAALAEIAALQQRLRPLAGAALHQAIRVKSLVNGHGAAIEVSSSLGRELVFVLSHTVHHNALIGAMCKTLGVPTPERFGYAPSTLAHLDGVSCAQSRSSR